MKKVLVGGCFDILHLGHIKLLEKSKKLGDTLVVLLESDQRVRKLKGSGRPINPQKDRAKVLKALKFVDQVILLKPEMSDSDYDSLVEKIKPQIIATTKNDPKIEHKKRAASVVGAKVVEVIDFIPQKSSTKLIEVLSQSDLEAV